MERVIVKLIHFAGYDIDTLSIALISMYHRLMPTWNIGKITQVSIRAEYSFFHFQH